MFYGVLLKFQVAEFEGAFSTRGLLEKLLSGEEKYADIFGEMLVEKAAPFTQLKFVKPLIFMRVFYI